jgi:tetratricopeptide (TPR) repeat protein
LANYFASRAEQAIVDGKQAEANKYLAQAESIDSKAVAVGLLRASIAEDKADERTAADLLARAAQQMEANHLSTPAGDNAVETYQAILQLQPGHNGALNGLEKIKQQYEFWLEAAIQKGNWEDATIYVRKALKLDPDDPVLAETLRKIAAAKRSEWEAPQQVGRKRMGRGFQNGTGPPSVVARNAQAPTPKAVLATEIEHVEPHSISNSDPATKSIGAE